MYSVSTEIIIAEDAMFWRFASLRMVLNFPLGDEGFVPHVSFSREDISIKTELRP